nr:hypothetical protein [Tanacetum cinerariifolium]
QGDQVQTSNDSPHSGGNTSERTEGGLNLQVLYNTCTLLPKQVLDLQNHKRTQDAEILKLKAMIKKFEKRFGKKGVYIQTGEKKNPKTRSNLDYSAFDDLDADIDQTMDYMETEEAMNEGRTSSKTEELNMAKDTLESNVTGDTVLVEKKGGSTEDPVSTAEPKDGTVKPKVDTAMPEVSIASIPAEITAPSTDTTIFADEDTIADVLVQMKHDKAKIKGKGVLQEEPKLVKEKTKYHDKAQIAMDEEIARKEYDDIQARINADNILPARLQEEEKDQFNDEERLKFLHDTIAAQRRQKKSVQDFVPIGYAEDERKIEEMNKKAAGVDTSKMQEVLKELDSTKVEVRQEKAEQSTRKRRGTRFKQIAKKKARKQHNADSDDEHMMCLKIVAEVEKAFDIEVLDSRSPNVDWKKISTKNGDYNVFYKADESIRYFNTLLHVLHIFYRQDLLDLYEIMMKQYLDKDPEGSELILLGDLKIMIDSPKEDDKNDLWKDQNERYPLTKELLQRMLELKLEVEKDSTDALNLIRFIKKQIAELESESYNGDGKDH